MEVHHNPDASKCAPTMDINKLGFMDFRIENENKTCVQKICEESLYALKYK